MTNEVAFARLCREYAQPVVFIRSKCDEDLHNLYEDGHIAEISAATARQRVETCESLVCHK